MKKLEFIILLSCLTLNIYGNILEIHKKAMSSYQKGKLQEAIDYFEGSEVEKILEGEEVKQCSNQRLASVLNDYAFLLLKKNKLEKSKVVLNKVIELDSQRTVAYYNLGEIAQIEGNTHMAREYILIYSYLLGTDKFISLKDPNNLIKGIKLNDNLPKLIENNLSITELNSIRLEMVSSYEVEQYKDYEYVSFVVNKGEKKFSYFYGEAGTDLWTFLFKINDLGLFKELFKGGYKFKEKKLNIIDEAKKNKVNMDIIDFLTEITDKNYTDINEMRKLILKGDIKNLKENMKNEEVIYKIDDFGYDLLDYAYKSKNELIIEYIKSIYKEKNIISIVKRNNIKRFEEIVKSLKGTNELKNMMLSKDYKGRTIMHLVAEYNFNEIAESYLKYVNILDLLKTENLREYYENKTPLHYASENGNNKILKLIMEDKDMKSIIDYKENYTGNTAIHYAVQNNSLDCVKILFLYGANIKVKNNMEETPLEMAIRLERKDIVDFLKKK